MTGPTHGPTAFSAPGPLEVTLTAADKDTIKKLLVEKATDYGIDPKTVDMAMPDKMSLSF